MADRFDYIVVGGGSAGATLAARLSEDSRQSAALSEASPVGKSPQISVPLGLMLLSRHKTLNWRHSSTAQRGLAGRSVSIPRGRVLGGSSAINGMVYIRGQSEDYDAWAQAGCAGWADKDVLPISSSQSATMTPILIPPIMDQAAR